MTTEQVTLADGRVTLYRGDCFAILPSLELVDACITDPPYCSGGQYRADRLMSVDRKYEQQGQALRRLPFSADGKDQRAFMSWTSVWVRLLPVKLGGYALSFIDWRQLPALTDAMQWADITWRGVCPWDKGGGARAPHKGYAKHQAEYIVWGTNGPCQVAAHGGPWPGVYRYPVLQNDKHHMAGKPTALMTDLCQWVEPGGTVLDPFMGSGTTGVAALRTGRRFIGIEIDPAHFETARQRIERECAALGL